MYYDWEHIFETKTNKELYEIVTLKTNLPKEAILYAKNELEKRSFDFDNMEVNTAAWRLSGLIEEEEIAQSEITGRRAKYVHPKIVLLIVAGIIIFYFSVKEFTNYDFPPMYLVFLICLAVLMVLLNNFIHKKQKKEHYSRIEKIKKYSKKLKENK